MRVTVVDPVKKHIAIITTSKKTIFKKFFSQLTEYARDLPGVFLLSDIAAEVPSELPKNVEDSQNEDETVLYFLKAVDTPLAKTCFEKADMIYIVAGSDSRPYLSRSIREKIHNYKSKPELILLHKKSDRLPKHTSKWLKLTRFGLYHHVRIEEEKDYQRILRFMRGRAVGVVLGGGGVRSWAHVGAIKAILDSGIPIDAIGGVSGGAIVAGYYAMYETYEDPDKELQALSKVTREAVALRNLNWPAVALFTSRAYTKKLKNIFGANTRIENLWLPYFSLACNLTHNTQVVQRSGLLWKKIRSSTSVPGIFPPVVVKRNLYLDGGLINNLPVDVMKKLLGNKSLIIAVELTHSHENNREYNFPPDLTFWQTLLAKLGIAYRQYKFPPFIDTFLKSLLAGASAKQKENGLVADVLVTPDLSKYSLLVVHEQQEHELMKLGFRAAVKAIRQWRRKIKVLSS